MTSNSPSWYIPGEGKQPTGPFTAEQLFQSWKAGKLTDTTMCWREGMTQWLPLVQAEPFASTIRSASVSSKAAAKAGQVGALPIRPESIHFSHPVESHVPQPRVSQEESATLSSPPGPVPQMPQIPTVLSPARVCEWCAESIPQQAMKCPRCSRWRKDLESDSRTAVTATVLAVISLAAIVLTCFFAWPPVRYWKQTSKWSEVAGGPVIKDDYPWHEKVLDPEDFTSLSRTNAVGAIIAGTLKMTNQSDPRYRFEFSPGKFLSSWSGWIVLLGSLSFLLTARILLRVAGA